MDLERGDTGARNWGACNQLWVFANADMIVNIVV